MNELKQRLDESSEKYDEEKSTSEKLRLSIANGNAQWEQKLEERKINERLEAELMEAKNEIKSCQNKLSAFCRETMRHMK